MPNRDLYRVRHLGGQGWKLLWVRSIHTEKPEQALSLCFPRRHCSGLVDSKSQSSESLSQGKALLSFHKCIPFKVSWQGDKPILITFPPLLFRELAC